MGGASGGTSAELSLALTMPKWMRALKELRREQFYELVRALEEWGAGA
jgi:hypothetical protein